MRSVAGKRSGEFVQRAIERLHQPTEDGVKRLVDARLRPLCGSLLGETRVRPVPRRPALDQIGLGQGRENIGKLGKPRCLAAVDDDLDAGIQFLILADFDVGGRVFAE